MSTGKCRKVKLLGVGLVQTCRLPYAHGPLRCDNRAEGDFEGPGSITRPPIPGDVDEISGQPVQIGQPR